MTRVITNNTHPVHNIRCTNCHSPLALWGNIHRSKTLSCQHCGTVMDSKRDFKALYTYTHIQQPQTTLRIGMQGIIRQVNFRITGFIVYKSRNTEWLHFQCYSLTHGYAHIISQQGRFIFLRHTYYLPDQNIWMLKQKDTFHAQHQDYVIDHFYFAEVFYAAGDLTMLIKQRQRNKQCFAYSLNSKNHGKNWYVSIQRRDKVEYYIGMEMTQNAIESLFSFTNN